MECQNYRKLFTLYLTDSLDPTQRSDFEAHLAGCSDCMTEFGATRKIWELLHEIPEPAPSESMRTGFNAILSNYKKETVNKYPAGEWLRKLKEYWYLQRRPRFAFSIVIITLGLFAGYMLHKPLQSANAYTRQIDSLTSQVSEMKQLIMLSLLQNPSASQRIRAVAYTEEISKVDMKVIDALFNTLNEDPNVNVRLATLEALLKFSDRPEVREGLVRSIGLQDSPLMQSAIADIMVKLHEKSSVESLKKLLTRKDLNDMVKLNIQKNINKLI